MFKRQIGISVYPEHFSVEECKQYIKLALKYKFRNVFMSLIHLGDNPKKEIMNDYLQVIRYAADLNMYIVLDVVDSTFKMLNISLQELKKFTKLGVSCLRLDSPLLPKDVANSTFQGIDIQINISNNDRFIENVVDFQPVLSNLSGCHNFYPLKTSALPINIFYESTLRFVNLGLHTSAFIGSKFGDRGPQESKVSSLVSVEKMRNLPIKNQAKWMFATNLISTVYIGNQFAKEQELIDLSNAMANNKFQFDLEIIKDYSEEEKNIIEFDNHFWRGDVNESFVRSTQPRVFFNKSMKPNNIKKNLNIGDVCIVNSKNNHYQNELIIIITNNFTELGDTVNYVGKISQNDIELLKIMKGWSKFEFKIK